jgi:hypothetical protein
MFILWIISMSATKPRTREPLDTRQRSILISFYNQNPYPSSSEYYQLVQLTGRTLKQIQDWFSNRRVSLSVDYLYFLLFLFSHSVLIRSSSLKNPFLLLSLHLHHLQW